MKYLILIAVIFLFQGIYFAYSSTETLGTEFVFSFANDDRRHLSDQLILTISNDNYISATINCEWWSLTRKQIKANNFTVKPYNHSSFEFDKKEVLFTHYSGYGQISEVPDNRIMISSSIPVSVTIQVSTIIPDSQDLYLVPSAKSLGKNYMVQLPEPSENEFQLVQFLPYNQDAQVNVTHYVNGSFHSKSTLFLNAKKGSDQQVMVREYHSSMTNSSFLIEASVPIAVVAAVTCVPTSSGCDYTAYMPQPLASWDGNKREKDVDSIFFLTENAQNVFIFPPVTEATDIELTIKSEKFDVMLSKISTKYSYRLNPTGTVEYLITSKSSSLRASRQLLNGNFIFESKGGSCVTNILSLSNFITGRTLFSPINRDSFVEIYTSVKNMNNIYLNDIPVFHLKTYIRVLSVTDYKYVVLVIDLTQLKAENYVLYSNDKYIAYFINIWKKKMACYELGYNN